LERRIESEHWRGGLNQTLERRIEIKQKRGGLKVNIGEED
jgi:hypothetical protein